MWEILLWAYLVNELLPDDYEDEDEDGEE